MLSIAQRIPEDVLEIVFAQAVLAKLPLVTEDSDKVGVATIEADSDISGIRWAKQSEILDRGLSIHFHPNYDFHSLLFVCRSWYPSAQRALYRSIAIGTNSQDHPDPRVYRRLLAALRANTALADMVQDLSLWLDADLRLSGYEILRRCTRVRNIRIYGYHGGLTARKELKEALASLPLLESLVVNRFGNPKFELEIEAEADYSGQVYSTRELYRMISSWPNLHTLVMLDDIISDDSNQVWLDGRESQLPAEGTLTMNFPHLRKFCIHRCQPPSIFYRSILASPSLPTLRVFRFWLNLETTETYLTLLRQTLIALAPSLQNLTLMWQKDVSLEMSLCIIDEATALGFHALIELHTAARLIPPSSVANLPNLKYLAYDTMDVGELGALYHVVNAHRTLCGLQFFTPITLLNGQPPDWMNPEEDLLDEMPDSWRIILALKSLCATRNILFEHSFGLSIVANLDDSDETMSDETELESDEYYNSDEYDDDDGVSHRYHHREMDTSNNGNVIDCDEEDSDSGYDGDNDR